MKAVQKQDIPTPALLLDLDAFETNLARMAVHTKQAGKALRPHAKAHKCVEIARRQIEAGAVGLRAEAEYELLLTQRWVLQPRLETNLYRRVDRQRVGEPGLDDIEAGLRLRYEIRREIAPYIGIERRLQFGPAGDAASDTRWVAGLRVAF